MKLFLLITIFAVSASPGLSKRLVCYYTNWSRFGNEPFKIEDIDASQCTHLVYSFMGLNDDGTIKSMDPWNDFGDEWTEGGLKRFVKLRNSNSSVKLLIGVGGWNEGPIRFQSLVVSPQKRQQFARSALAFVQQHKFDGLEIDWIWHSASGTPEVKAGFSFLLNEMKPIFAKNNYILGIATSANPSIFDSAYDIAVLTKVADFVSVLSYDLHGSWDGKTGHVAPLRPMAGETAAERELNLEAVINRYISKGAIPEKLNLAVVTYGRTFTLRDPNNWGIGAPTTGPGTVEPLPYRTFCLQDKNNVWKKHRNEEQVVPYAVSGNQWVGYEDVQSLKAKVNLSKSKKIGGISVWSFDMDDFKGSCGQKFPLLKAVKTELFK